MNGLRHHSNRCWRIHDSRTGFVRVTLITIRGRLWRWRGRVRVGHWGCLVGARRIATIRTACRARITRVAGIACVAGRETAAVSTTSATCLCTFGRERQPNDCQRGDQQRLHHDAVPFKFRSERLTEIHGTIRKGSAPSLERQDNFHNVSMEFRLRSIKSGDRSRDAGRRSCQIGDGERSSR